MKTLKLPYKTILYIPLKDGEDHVMSQETVDILLDKSLRSLIAVAGGATVIEGRGYWENQNTGDIEHTKTMLIICYIEDISKGEKLLRELALWVKEQTNSQAICYEINNCLYMV